MVPHTCISTPAIDLRIAWCNYSALKVVLICNKGSQFGDVAFWINVAKLTVPCSAKDSVISCSIEFLTKCFARFVYELK